MHARKILSAAICTILLWAPAQAFAAEENYVYSGWNGSLGVGMLFPEEDEEIQEAIIIEARLGYDVSESWTVEGSLGYMPYLNANRFDPPATSPQNMRFRLADDTWGLRSAVDALYHLNEPGDRKFDPFLAATAGVRYVSANLENGQHFDPFGGVGFGAAYQVCRNWQVRGDYRLLMVGHDSEYNHRALVSLGYRWGQEVGTAGDGSGAGAREAGLANGPKPVYFDFDSSDLTDDAQQDLKHNAEWLEENPETQVTLEGHCDERGTNEYNLALGQRRAESAKQYLRALGVDGQRLDPVTYGEDKPAVPESNEAAWAKNRRVECVPK